MANILIVEDEPAVQELLAFNMKQCGYHVIQAYDTVSALTHINWVMPLPDLILLDWMLPGISGVEFARRLRADQRTHHIPIIMLTARTDERDKALGMESGVDDYITKPFSPRELMARIHAILGSRMPHIKNSTVRAGEMGLSPPAYTGAGKAMPDPDIGSSDVIWL